MGLQGLSVAISPAGLETFFSKVVAGDLTAALEPPALEIKVPDSRHQHGSRGTHGIEAADGGYVSVLTDFEYRPSH
ncbi:MAG: hypothetical protein AAF604_24220 [Acidobacteriota bacterium]